MEALVLERCRFCTSCVVILVDRSSSTVVKSSFWNLVRSASFSRTNKY